MAVVKLTPAAVERIVAGIEIGADRVQASVGAGVPFEVFREWVRLGEKGAHPYAAFLRSVERAEAVRLMRALVEHRTPVIAGTCPTCATIIEQFASAIIQSHDTALIERMAEVWGRIGRAHGLLPR